MQRFFVHLLLLAFLIRSFVPVGFMPGQGPEGTTALVICSSAGGTATIYLPDSGHKSHAAAHGGEFCAFSAAFATGALPAAPQIALLAGQRAHEIPAPSLRLAAAPAKHTLSQGPPVFS